MRHDNVNPWVGACIDPGRVCVLTDYCARGSLRDILDGGDDTAAVAPLDHMFVASLLFDLLRGLAYLHCDCPALGHHGNLKTSNCLVDSRWQLRLADFGLAREIFGEDGDGGQHLGADYFVFR